MPIPAFDGRGNLPVGEHDATLDEVEKRFGTTRRRRELFVNLRMIVGLLDVRAVDGIWIDGSFVTHKHRPSDIDMVFLPSPGENPDNWGLLSEARHYDVKRLYGIDLWLYSSYEIVNTGFGRIRMPIKDFFCRDRDDHRKGIVRLDYR